MLGFVDLLRAVRGTATLLLRRLEGPAGVVLLVVVGALAVGAVAWGVGGGGDSTPDAAPSVRTHDESDAESDEPGRDADGGEQDSPDEGTSPPGPEPAAPGEPPASTTTSGPEAVPGGRDGAGGSVELAPGADVGTATVPPTTPPPSTTPSSTAPIPTTTSTVPPRGGLGGVVGGLVDVLGLLS